MRLKLISAAGPAWFSAALVLLISCSAASVAAEKTLKMEAQLIWGTNDQQSPDPKHKPVDADILKKLNGLPLKWNNYFSVNRKSFEVTPAATTDVPLSNKCRVEVKSLGGSKVEVALFGRGEHVIKQTQALPKGEVLILAGNAPNATVWLVTLKRVE